MRGHEAGLVWRKSSHSGTQGGDCIEVAPAWRTSSRSAEQGGECVEVALAWRKSGRSGTTGECVEVAPTWQKSSHSGTTNNCVEAASGGHVILTRDSRDPDGGTLAFRPAEWAALIKTLKRT
ncbi:DUF397 domain-containing protein [Actinomadura parmotrematis]|uniref:DUF397 domain-containing protein n=1 Tax=Actinomadura parmotrematis TaxID=2864039 RepID=A0ABS7FT86_9ACTN|nr:DUF397 domain-containing protein [Actinomadura parmotrematis]MBW8483619.1 DUF397 domain-containing protein [Actinomadura parmotrematis]